MDFLKILRSLEEFLYEAMTWLIFYPRTFWRILFTPMQMVAYARKENDAKGDVRFADAISPPLFLMLTIGLSHVLELMSHNQVAPMSNIIGQAVFGNEQNLLIYRSIGYSIWPLIFAAGMLRRTKVALNRETLRGPFFAQCFLTAPFALSENVGVLLMRGTHKGLQIVGACLAAAAFLWYLAVQIRWVRLRLQCAYFRAAGISVLNIGLGGVVNLALAVAMAL